MTPEIIVKYFGGQAATARALGMSQPSIAGWVKSGVIPQLRQYQIEVLTKGKFKAKKKRNVYFNKMNLAA
jgi:DNA-binding transcriptional regulator YdaS (Cro superfamily)